MTDKDRFYRDLSVTQHKYRLDVREYVEFMKKRGLLMLKALKEYAAWLNQEHDGKRYSAEAINRKILAAKSRIRYAFRHSSAAGSEPKAQRLEEVMREVRPKRVKKRAPTSGAEVSGEEVRRLLNESKERDIKLLVRFLAGTGVQLSEMLSVKLIDLKPVDERFFEIKVAGEGHKDRLVHIGTGFIEQARECFLGTTYLFEHDGKQFSVDSVALKIKQEALNTIGREVTPDQLRHRWATVQIHRGRGLREVVARLGHVDRELSATGHPDTGSEPRQFHGDEEKSGTDDAVE